MKRQINNTLIELITGIIISAAVVEVLSILVAGFSWKFTSGMWIGAATAIGLAAHMYRSIDRALDMQPDDADKYMRRAYLIRTAVILLVAGAVTFLKLGYVMATFVGVFCLKFGAFLQPLTHRMLHGKDEAVPDETGEDDPPHTDS